VTTSTQIMSSKCHETHKTYTFNESETPSAKDQSGGAWFHDGWGRLSSNGLGIYETKLEGR